MTTHPITIAADHSRRCIHSSLTQPHHLFRPLVLSDGRGAEPGHSCFRFRSARFEGRDRCRMAAVIAQVEAPPDEETATFHPEYARHCGAARRYGRLLLNPPEAGMPCG